MSGGYVVLSDIQSKLRLRIVWRSLGDYLGFALTGVNVRLPFLVLVLLL